MERIEGLHERGRQIVSAWLIGDGIGNGKALREQYDRWQSDLRHLPGAPTIDDATKDTIARVVATWTPRRPAEVS